MIVGMGTDIIDIERVEALWRERGGAFARRVFTQGEVAYCTAKHSPGQHLAGRFAAKEAALKALGTGWAKGIGLKDVEVIHRSEGPPLLSFHGRAKKRARTLGIHRSWLSISHAGGMAAAVVVLEKRIPRRMF